MLGHDRVRVVSLEEIKTDQVAVMKMVLDFLGLCEWDFGRIPPDNVTPFMVKQKFQATRESFVMLQAFFKPFNYHLYRLIGRDLGWEKTRFESLKLRLG